MEKRGCAYWWEKYVKPRQKRGEEPKPLTYFSLFRYSTKYERACVALAILLAVFSGCIPPIINILYGEFCNLMITREYPTDKPTVKMNILPLFGGGKILRNATRQQRKDALKEDSVAWGSGCAAVTLALFFFSMFSVFLLCFTASRQMSRIKVLFFKSVLCKDLAWFDTRMKGNFPGQAAENLLLIERGIAEVLSVFIFHLSVGFINLFVSFFYGWLLALSLLALISPFVLCSLFIAKWQSELSVEEMLESAKAVKLAEEVFSCIKTVVAFGGEKKEIERYANILEKSKKYEIRKGVVCGISNGLMWFIIYCSYSITFVVGVRFIETSWKNGDEEYTPAVVLIILFGIITALTSLGYATGRLATFSMACGAGAIVFETINTKASINPCSREGKTMSYIKGEIEFRDVYFEYPSRAGVTTLEGLNLKINAGEKVAIVGESGAGKSTILHLVQRLYDPTRGSVLIDGEDIKSFNVSWLRQQLGVVRQDTEIFTTTIRNNIRYGFLEATDEDIKQAAVNANAYDFIMELKEGFNTKIGQKGSALSGGQKQRIAIARALVGDPKILLLDEMTSGLDAVSENMTVNALTKACEGRTTLIVTHRLSTIENVDRIIVLSKGVVAEAGTHNELLKINGIYRHLLQTQEEHVKEKILVKKLMKSSAILYQRESTVLPPGPRGRFSSVTGLPRRIRSESLRPSERYREMKFADIIKWTRPELVFFFIGSVASVICGAALPTVCILFGDVVGLLRLTDFNFIKYKTDLYAAVLVAVAVTSGLCVYIQIYCFATAGVKLSSRLRVRAFRCLISQEMSYFDDERNAVGALSFRLSQDASWVQGTFDIRIGFLMQALSTISIGLVISFVYNLKITLVTLATLPFLFSGVYIESVFASGSVISGSKSMEKASKIAVEVISNIKTVMSLARESFFIDKYEAAIAEGNRRLAEKIWLRSFAFAVGQAAPFLGYAVTLWYGGMLVADENVPYKYVIKISELLIFGTWTLGQSVVLGPSLRETKYAANRLNSIFSRLSRVPDGHAALPDEATGKRAIGFSKVTFAYPAKSSTMALQNFTMKINPGTTVAIMGASGSGKSTIIQLLLRFYDPLSGIITLGNANLKGYKLGALRKIFGVVSQRSDLFDRTIEENIAYGDNSRSVPLKEVINAAKAANIHSFIESLPMGYATQLGPTIQVSGGEKQRIAIARVLIRNPEILLLDEATSALDAESEIVVQEALDAASRGRTTITIAHRLRATKTADFIYVLDKGTVREFGTREELLKLKGHYYTLLSGTGEEEEKTKPGTSAE